MKLTFSEAMLLARRRRGLSQFGLAAEVGTSPTYIHWLENDSERIPAKSAAVIRRRVVDVLGEPELFALASEEHKEVAA